MTERKEKFTPGPWYIKPREGIKCTFGISYTRTTILNSMDGEYKSKHVIAQIARGNGREEENAALISKAPEMYAELKDLLDAMESGAFPQVAPGVDYPAVMEKKWELRKLLKEARGEE